MHRRVKADGKESCWHSVYLSSIGGNGVRYQ